MNPKYCFLPAAALLSVLLLTSCASSERLMRISAVQSYTPPKYSRIDGFQSLPPSYRQYKTAPADRRNELDFNASLVNVWPVFFRGGEYYSVLWPMIDCDPYGFAVRPFFNQEGNEYSVLFPFSAWNPVHGDGWVFNTYWTSRYYGSFPFFHRNPNPSELTWFGPVWYWDRSGGFFPLASFGRGLNYVLLAYWNSDYDTGKVYSGGFLPLAHFGPQWNFAGPAWWYRDDNRALRSGGFFPLAQFGRGFNYALLAYWNKEEDGRVGSAGFFPLVWLGKQWNIAGPVWWYRDGNLALRSGGFFPLARFSNEDLNYATLAFWGKSGDTGNYYKGFFPLAYFGDQWNYATLAWWYRNDAGHLQSGGFFPLARFGDDINYAGPVWWYHGPVHSSGGFFPLVRFSNAVDPLQYVGPFWYWQDCWGFFPAFRWSDKNIINASLLWFDRRDESFGLLPLFRYTDPTSHFVCPLYILASQGNFFLSPLLYYNYLPEEQNLSVPWLLFWRYRFERSYRDDFNPAFNWTPEKEKEFNLIGLLGYAGKKTRYAWDKNVRFKYEMNSPASIKNNEDLIRYDFFKLGYSGKIPETDPEIRQTKLDLYKYTHTEIDRYFGMVPLFHYEKSPADGDVRQETSFRLLYILPYYRNSPDKVHFSALGPILFQYEDKKESFLAGKLFGDRNIRREQFISAVLLSTFREDTFYVKNDRLKALLQAYETFLNIPDAATRARTEAYLKQVDPKLTLPASVTSGRTFRAWLEEVEPTLGLETRVEHTGGFLPILLKSKNDFDNGYNWFSLALLSSFNDLSEGYKWFSIPLLSWGEDTRDTKKFVSLPLLSGYKKAPDEKTVAAPILLYFNRERRFGREQAEIVEEKDLFNATRSAQENTTLILMGLGHSGHNEFLVPKIPGTARNLSALRQEIEMHLGRLSREASLLDKIARDKALVAAGDFRKESCDTPTQCRALAARIKKIKPSDILCSVLPSMAIQLEQLAQVRKQLDTSEETILALCAKLKIPCDAKQLADRNREPAVKGTFRAESGKSVPLPFQRDPTKTGANSPAGKYLTVLREQLYKDHLEVRERNRIGSLLTWRLSSGDNFSWHVFGILANGYKIGDREETRILYYLYRHRSEGVRSERLIFPFISTRADGDDSRWSFLWRVLDFKTEKGHTSGHIFFIPFG
ncbi:MAG: hypothetical protein BWY31_04048 [Lentisphaerae bacterium ADurb.Bin242]|nr:MAG: hypothetical protein BWY31_04048 [Lentisphaerae bacterium ADurb.Bin242]